MHNLCQLRKSAGKRVLGCFLLFSAAELHQGLRPDHAAHLALDDAQLGVARTALQCVLPGQSSTLIFQRDDSTFLGAQNQQPILREH